MEEFSLLQTLASVVSQHPKSNLMTQLHYYMEHVTQLFCVTRDGVQYTFEEDNEGIEVETREIVGFSTLGCQDCEDFEARKERENSPREWLAHSSFQVKDAVYFSLEYFTSYWFDHD
jgi:hypothetical protein